MRAIHSSRSTLAAIALRGVAALASAIAPAVAVAQASHEIETRVTLIEPLTLTKVSDLNFGDIVPANGGTVTLIPTPDATCTTSAGMIQTGACQPATFTGFGAQGQRVRVRRPAGNTIALVGPGEPMMVTNFTINGDPELSPVRSNPVWERYRIASADGSFTFRVGGTLNVNPDQAAGVYTGTFEIRIDYQ